MKSEKQIQVEIMQALAGDSRLRLWRANAGVGRSLDGERVVAYGVPGQADLTGIASDGRRLEIEVKAHKGRLSEQQERFRDMIGRFGGIYIVARSADEAVVAINKELR